MRKYRIYLHFAKGEPAELAAEVTCYLSRALELADDMAFDTGRFCISYVVDVEAKRVMEWSDLYYQETPPGEMF